MSEHGIPAFEGENVDYSRAKLLGASKIDLGEDILAIDQAVALLVTGHVARVEYVVNNITGRLERSHTIRVTDAHIVEDT
jgi:hypothetical protein